MNTTVQFNDGGKSNRTSGVRSALRDGMQIRARDTLEFSGFGIVLSVMKHRILVARVFLTLAIFLTAASACAGLVGRRACAARARNAFDEGDIREFRWRGDSARDDTPADKQARLTALNLLLDADYQSANVDEYPGTQQWIEDDLALERELHWGR